LFPEAFLPAAKWAGLVGALTDHGFGIAVGVLRAWEQQGLNVDMAMSIPARFFRERESARRVVTLLDASQLAYSRVTLEISETDAATASDQTICSLTELCNLGVRLSIEKFGVGQTSLKRLMDLPLSELKIDGSFIARVCDSAAARTIVRSVVRLAHDIGISVCAEGVNTLAALQFLVSTGCDRAQGSAIALPLSWDRPYWLAKRGRVIRGDDQ
jgi:EAL domain-containing protein (putative c-di-GMP-specific phosphodiesterase class I)